MLFATPITLYFWKRKGIVEKNPKVKPVEVRVIETYNIYGNDLHEVTLLLESDLYDGYWQKGW